MRQPYRFVNGWTTTASPNSTSRTRRYGASLPGASATVLRCGRNDGASLPHVALAASVTDDLSVPTGVLANSLGECVTTSSGSLGVRSTRLFGRGQSRKRGKSVALRCEGFLV